MLPSTVTTRITMKKEINTVNEEILKKIVPTREDRAKIAALAKELKQKVTLACEEHGLKALVRVEGSVAKDTWLREEHGLKALVRVEGSVAETAESQCKKDSAVRVRETTSSFIPLTGEISLKIA